MQGNSVHIVSATRSNEADFWLNSLLGRSLSQPQHCDLSARICFNNSEPLPLHYNASIDAVDEGIIIFCHDDVDLGASSLIPSLEAALERFNIVGVAGNQRSWPGQSSWWLKPNGIDFDYPFLSGAISHGLPESAKLDVFGPTPMPVLMLDGVFIAVNVCTLHNSNLRFDQRFAFHLYDSDFCKSAQLQGFSMGTWPLSLVHASGGDIANASFHDALVLFKAKWNNKEGSNDITDLFKQARSFEQSSNWAEAEAIYCSLLDSLPNHPGLLLRYGCVLFSKGDFAAASQPLRQALAIAPHLTRAADLLLALALEFQLVGQLADAIELQRCVLRAFPKRLDMLFDLGSSLMLQGKIDAAKACFSRLLKYSPQHPAGLHQLGLVEEALGNLEEAYRLQEAALKLSPDNTEVLLCFELLRLQLCDWVNHEERLAILQASILNWIEQPFGSALSPLRLLYLPFSLDIQRSICERWVMAQCKQLASRTVYPRLFDNNIIKNRRLRIGYLSADFRDHAMGSLIHGVFAYHDRSRFEVFAYALADIDDVYSDLVKKGVEHFLVVAGFSDEQLAARISSDGIDILIDLMGHTHHNRIGVLARKPAAIQLHYLGFPGSLGCDFIDGVIADQWLIPPEHEYGYLERVFRLPWGFVSSPAPNSVLQSHLDKSLREQLGLLPEHIVFACFNRIEKINPNIFAVWMEILKAVPDVVLLLVLEQPIAKQRLSQQVANAGVDPERLFFSNKVSSAVFPELCGVADLLLDTSPYGSGATAVAALAAGVPLLTCPGNTFASRMGASLCAATGLEHLICSDFASYLDCAVGLGNNPAELTRLKRFLVDGRHSLPLFNTGAWVGHLEQLFEQLADEFSK